MHRFGVLVIASASFLMGCTRAEEDPATDGVAVRDATAITYAQTACMGFCPVFDVTVNEEGQGAFEGHEHVAQQGLREFHISSEQFQELERQLAPLRPTIGDVSYNESTRCQGGGVPPTDGSFTVITWHGSQGNRQTMQFYAGCPQDDIRDRLYDALHMLPIDDLIGVPAG